MLGLRMVQRSTPALRNPALRQFGARRLNSQGIGAKGFEGAADNAFNRERQAVKDHAASSSGTSDILVRVVVSVNVGNDLCDWRIHNGDKRDDEDDDDD